MDRFTLRGSETSSDRCRPYCKALKDRDFSVCDPNKPAKGPWGFDFGEFAYSRDSLKNQKIHFDFVGKQ